ncbi:hypothetical protein Z951_45840 [Streptomyces sp. PRh5]|nr:hypothetical protein Z951_45840 [Streptomyces sp. PRh5]
MDKSQSLIHPDGHVAPGRRSAARREDRIARQTHDQPGRSAGTAHGIGVLGALLQVVDHLRQSPFVVLPNFGLYRPSEEHDMLRDAIRSLAEAKIAPHAAAVDEEARFPQEALDALVANDLHAVHVPEEYGGAGANALATVIVIEKVARSVSPRS